MRFFNAPIVVASSHQAGGASSAIRLAIAAVVVFGVLYLVVRTHRRLVTSG
jgi:hypothetical protein